MNKRKKLSLTLFVLSLFIFFISGVLFCYSLYKNNNNMNNRTIVLTYLGNSNELKIDNTSPITDALGKKIVSSGDDFKTGYVEFSLSADLEDNEEIVYELCLRENNVERQIGSKYIKLYLTDANTDMPVSGFYRNVPSFYDLKISKSNINFKRLYKGSLKAGEVKDFRLRMWLDDIYTISNDIEMFNVSIAVNILN